jgi:hypothetical protein
MTMEVPRREKRTIIPFVEIRREVRREAIYSRTAFILSVYRWDLIPSSPHTSSNRIPNVRSSF